MKTFLKIIFLGVLTVLMAIAATAKDSNTNPTNEKHLFVVKTGKDMVGAKVEVVLANGHVIAEQVLKKRKLVIDFNESRSGYYTIRVIKGSRIREYYYQKV